MKDEFKTITLDYDNIAWNECHERIGFILNDRKDILKIQVYNSPLSNYKKNIWLRIKRKHSYHLYIYMIDYIQWNEIMYLREKWKDDRKRIEIDLLKTIPETKMIMFRSKTRKGYKFNEIFVGEYWT